MNIRVEGGETISTSLRRARPTFPEGGRALRRKRILKRIRRINVKTMARRSLSQGRKWMDLRHSSHLISRKVPLFIVGCNRSGTTMLCDRIGKSSHVWAYHESECSLAFKGYYLRADWVIDLLIRRTPAPVVAFKSILDSQLTPALLERFEGAQALWVYRRYGDVANSCARMSWRNDLKNLVRWVARGELDKLGARGIGINDELVRLFAELFRESLSNFDCACLYWYMRNQIFFDLGLHADPRVTLVQYEDTVLNPDRVFRRIFDELGQPFEAKTIRGIFATSVSKHCKPVIQPNIEEACDALQARLDAHYDRSREARH